MLHIGYCFLKLVSINCESILTTLRGGELSSVCLLVCVRSTQLETAVAWYSTLAYNANIISRWRDLWASGWLPIDSAAIKSAFVHLYVAGTVCICDEDESAAMSL